MMQRDPVEPQGEEVAKRRSRAADLLLLASVVVPLLVMLGVSAQDYRRTMKAAGRELMTTAETVAGHARNVFRFEALALGATGDWLRGVSDSDILPNPPNITSD